MARRSKENAVDWDLIERQYRLGTKSNKQLAAEFGVSASSIGRQATKYGWMADKSEDVRAVTRAMQIKGVSGNATGGAGNATKNATVTQSDINAAAAVNSAVIDGHKESTKRESKLADRLLVELEDACAPEFGESLKELADILAAGDQKAAALVQRRIDAALQLSGRIDDFKKLIESRSRIRSSQREAFGIDAGGKSADGGYENLLAAVLKG